MKFFVCSEIPVPIISAIPMSKAVLLSLFTTALHLLWDLFSKARFGHLNVQPAGVAAERDKLKLVGHFKQLLLQEVLEELQHFGILAAAETTDGPLTSLDRCCGISSNFD